MKRNGGSHVLELTLIVVLIGMAAYCQKARWDECRRYHPRWYCLSEGK